MVTIHFIGGPYDGHDQNLAVPQTELSETVSLPVCEHVFEMLEGRGGGSKRQTSIAMYQLDGLNYRFIGSVKPQVRQDKERLM